MTNYSLSCIIPTLQTKNRCFQMWTLSWSLSTDE